MKLLAIVVFMTVGMGVSAQSVVSTNEAAEIVALRCEAESLRKKTVVRWREFDGSINPRVNVVRKKGNVVEISKVFACPTHKGHAYDESGRCSFITDLTHRWANCPDTCDSKTKWCEWNEYRKLIEEGKDVQMRLSEIDSRIAEIEATARLRAEEVARQKMDVKDEGKIVVERVDQLLVRIKVGTLMRALAGDRIEGNTLRIYYQDPEESSDM